MKKPRVNGASFDCYFSYTGMQTDYWLLFMKELDFNQVMTNLIYYASNGGRLVAGANKSLGCFDCIEKSYFMWNLVFISKSVS